MQCIQTPIVWLSGLVLGQAGTHVVISKMRSVISV